MITPKINFFCIGTQKAGTTSLHDILKEHPDIFLPEEKEAHFFDIEEHYQLGLDWYYNEYFASYKNELIAGSFTPEYCFYPQVPERIYKAFGVNMKFIFILRQPVDRAISHYNMSKGRLYENLSFEEAVNQEKTRIKKGDFEFNNFSYFSRGYYSKQIKRYLQFYKRDQFLFLDFDQDIVRNLPQTLYRIQKFLGVPVVELDDKKHSNKSFQYKSNKITRYYLPPREKKSHWWKKLVPSGLKAWIKSKIINFYRIENREKFKLSEQDSKRFYNDYFKEEVIDLQKITKMDLSHWER